MCENVLKSVLDGVIPINLLLDSLINRNSDVLFDNKCGLLDFVLYFLNYVHELQDIKEETPNKFPKRLQITSPVSPLYQTPTRSTKLMLGDFITTSTPKTNRRRSGTRRINPTSLNFNTSASDFLNNSFSFNGVNDNSDGQRSVLLDECKTVVSPCKTGVKLGENRQEIVPDIGSVTCKEKLDKLVAIYDCLLAHDYVVNLAGELRFYVSNLLVKQFQMGGGSLPFKSVHDRTYFTSNVLLSFSHVLALLDKPTIRLLTENKRLFVTIKPLEFQAENVPEPPSPGTNVCFVLETDNRENFPNDVSFRAFRKQRDLFYEILGIWERHRLRDNWCFGMSLGGRIRNLLNMHADAVNMAHLAELFKAQLLANACGKNGEDLSFVPNVSNIDSEKLQRLRTRILGGGRNQSEIRAPPAFTGYEEFYRDFIATASHHAFNKHLTDSLICEITELNGTKFDCVDLDGRERVVSKSTKTLYVACLNKLLVLGKFLGYLDGLPYVSVGKADGYCLAVRGATQPGLNLTAVLGGNLILTVPWLTKYLAMLDSVALQTPSFAKLLNRLFEIYTGRSTIPRHNLLFIKVNLGWLFELPNFPVNCYYDFLKSCCKKDIPNGPLDVLNVLDHSIIYMSCPFLDEIRRVLAHDAVTLPRHITPLTTVTHKPVQPQLQEAFFNGQPVSVRKTVEFVSERVASACVKVICNEIVPQFRGWALARFREAPEGACMRKTAEAEHLDVCGTIDATVRGMSDKRVRCAVEALLAPDVLDQTKDVCVSIAVQMCLERIQQWVNSHVNAGIFVKDFETEIKKRHATKHKHKAGFLTRTSYNENALSGRNCMQEIRSLIWRILEDPDGVTTCAVENLVESVHSCFGERGDLTEQVVSTSCKMLVDLAVLLLSHRPRLWNEFSIEKRLLDIWRKSDDDFFVTFVSSRNINVLMRSSDVQLAGRNFVDLAEKLIAENLLTKDEFESQVVGVCGQDVDEETRNFLQNLLSNYTDLEVLDQLSKR